MNGDLAQTHIANQEDEIKKILKHLGFWKVGRKPRPKANAEPFIPDSNPILSADDYMIDPDYPVDAYL
jgi:hypothetical protein